MPTTNSPANNSSLSSQNKDSKKAELDSTLLKLTGNSHISHITIAISPDACSPGRDIQGTYQKHLTPEIPVETCSRPDGCSCRYIPVLKEIFP